MLPNGPKSRKRPLWTTTKRRMSVKILVEDEDPTLRTLVTRINLTRGEHESVIDFEQRLLNVLQELPVV